MCCSESPLTHQMFEFYREDSLIYFIAQDQNCTSQIIKITTQQDIGPYYCAYKAVENGTDVQSNMSHPITFQYADTPLPPNITLVPLFSVYTTKESVHLECAPPDGTAVKGIQIYKEGNEIHEGVTLKSRYEISASNKDAPGRYYCKYWVEMNGRSISSSPSEHVTINVTNPPQAPSIILNPKLPVYIKGENVNITCSFPEQSTVISIQYIKDNQEIHRSKTPKTMSTYVLSNLSLENTGQYKCQYWVKTSGRQISSNASVPISIIVEDTPLPPNITLVPLFSVYTTKESVHLECAPPDGTAVKGIQIYKEGNEIHEGVALKSRYEISASNKDAPGRYYCKYWVEMNGRSISSSPSEHVTINVTNPPQAPSIILNPKLPVYIKGENVNITCSFPEQSTVISIQYIKDNQEIHRSKTPKTMSTYVLSNLSLENTGQYKCQYWVTTSGRQISSNASVPISIIVEDTPLPPNITLVPLFSVYTTKESVHLECAPPDGTAVKGIQIYKEGNEIHEGVTLKSRYEISASDKDAPGRYYCKYWVEMNGRSISSSPSEHVTINVTNTPLPPNITLVPLFSVYTTKESVHLECAPPDGTAVKGIQIYKEGNEIHEGVTLKSRYEISASNKDAPGRYYCKYWVEMNGRSISSSPSEHVTINVTNPPQAPSIILNPKLPVYIKGENVNITCSFPEQSTVISIQYIKDNQEIHRSKTPKTMSTYVLSNLSLENTGQYKCQYWVTTSGRQISSNASVPISIIVEDPPITPVLKLAPALEIYVVGESLVFTCSGLVNARHTIYKDGQLLQNDFFHLIPSVQLYHNGSYTCAYNFDNKGRQMESSRSQAVNIYVIEPLPAPILTLGRPIEKVEEGFVVTLNCSAPDEDLLRTFYYFSTTEDNHLANLTGFSTSLELEVGHISQIAYICEYEQELKGRTIRSRRSQTLSIQLSEASIMSPPVIAGIIGTISLLLCFTLALWFYMKSKRYNRLNRFRFSWYWKENRSPKRPHAPQPLCPLKETEETNQILDISGKDHYKIVSINPACLSIATQKETDALDGAMNFSTFHCKNVSEGDAALNSSGL
ncbi:Fc receptor-like protein 5 isoform X3 [Bufo gargarizans]|nr:Fc receptor-like protein 5 isoform X3 [Bufo gargarizans]XP_044130648.1 Fc receptor-like protein 5 isoform X3 [Bufo gargarizans]